MADKRDVTGVWYGRWDSPNPLIYPSSFIALLEELSGAVSGSISEPDRYSSATLHAHVAGRRTGERVEWIKQYDGEGLAHAVRYAGNINAEGTEIAGEWQLQRYSGSFVMGREKFDVVELAAEEETELTVH